MKVYKLFCQQSQADTHGRGKNPNFCFLTMLIIIQATAIVIDFVVIFSALLCAL